LLLKFTGNDLEGAMRILEAVPKDIFAVKMKFITQIAGYVGAFFFCFDQKEGIIKRLIGVISEDKEIGKVDVREHWIDFENQLYEYATTKKIDGGKIEQFKSRLQGGEFLSHVAGLLRIGKSIDHDSVNNLFLDKLYNVFADTNIAVKFEIEMTDAFELNKGKNMEETEQQQSVEPEEVNQDLEKQEKRARSETLILLKVDPVLSPVSGIEVRDLEYGDQIQVRITDDREIADYLAELIGAKVDSVRVPVYSEVVDCKELEGGYIGMFTQFGPGIMGSFRVPEDAKVVCRRVVEEEEETTERKRGQIHPLVVMGGIVSVVVLLVLLIVMSR
jgi:hypothetical protein